MKKDEVLKYVEGKPESEFVIRTKEEDDTYLQNYGKDIEDRVIPDKIKELHTRYDDDIFAVTGLKKGATEKTYDFVKRVLSEYRGKAEKSAVLESEISDLKKKIADGSADKKTLADLEAVQKAYKELEKTKNGELEKVKKEYDQYRVKSEISGSFSGLSFKKNIPEAAINALKEQSINKLVGLASYQDGKLVFLKEDGTVMRNAHNALNPYTAVELLREDLKDVLDSGQNKPGGPDISKEVGKEYKDGKLSKISLMIPDSVKTKEDLSKYLIGEAKLLRGTEEYFMAYKEYGANLPIR